MQLKDCIAKRQSVRSYARKPVKWNAIAEILDAGRLVPLAGNIPTLKFIVVSDAELRKRLAEACVQDFIALAPYLIVVCSDMLQISREYDERAERYARQQAGAAIENMLLRITDLGLASCWIGAYDDNSVKRILEIPDEIFVEAIIPVAYKSATGREGRRKKIELKNILYFEKWNQKEAKPERMGETR